MIVICTRCQAKFRVADERIGPRGAKVRCSKCQTVFAVHQDLGSLPAEAPAPVRPRASSGALDVELEPGKATPRPLHPPPADGPAPTPAPRAQQRPPPLPSAAPAPGEDPFAAAGADPFAPASAAFAPPAPDARGDDPFPDADPFASTAPAATVEPGDGDPFAASPASLLAQAADPFSAAVTPRAPSPAAGASALPLTDLADLLGEPTPGAVRAPAPSRAWAAQPGASDDDGLGLALEERLTPPPLAAGANAFGEPEAPPPPAGFDADPFGAASSDPHAFDPAGLPGPGGRTDELPLALATERTPVAAPEPPWTTAVRGASSSPRLPAAPPPPPPAPAAEAPHADRIPGARGARVRALAVNAAALAVLLLVAFALLAGWRAGGGLDLASLRPAAVLDTLRGRAVETYVADQVSSGIYERALGPPVLFVRGVATSRAPGPVGGLRVRVEVTRGEAVIARGEALAGAVPTAEELHGADDGVALAAVVRAAAARRPRRIRPGEAVPFLVVIADHPADLAGAALHLSVEPAGKP